MVVFDGNKLQMIRAHKFIVKGMKNLTGKDG